MPQPDLGFPLRHSRGARQSVAEALKAAGFIGGGIGYSIGQTLGWAAGVTAGRVEGVITGSVVTSCAWAAAVFIAYLFLRASRK